MGWLGWTPVQTPNPFVWNWSIFFVLKHITFWGQLYFFTIYNFWFCSSVHQPGVTQPACSCHAAHITNNTNIFTQYHLPLNIISYHSPSWYFTFHVPNVASVPCALQHKLSHHMLQETVHSNRASESVQTAPRQNFRSMDIAHSNSGQKEASAINTICCTPTSHNVIIVQTITACMPARFQMIEHRTRVHVESTSQQRAKEKIMSLDVMNCYWYKYIKIALHLFSQWIMRQFNL